jgi:histidinol phosphatase-like enzyme
MDHGTQELPHHGAHIDKIYYSFDTSEAATEGRKPGTVLTVLLAVLLTVQELAHHDAHIDKIYCSFDTPEAATERRKPGTGMILEAMQDFSVPSGADCVFIGDTLGDMQVILLSSKNKIK